MEAIEGITDMMDEAEVEKAVRLLFAAKRIAFNSMDTCVWWRRMPTVNAMHWKACHANAEVHVQRLSAASLKPGDVVISCSGETCATISIIAEIRAVITSYSKYLLQEYANLAL